MIQYVQGDLLKADVDALVNTVNTEGVMGKGIALQFKKAFPENFRAYVRACKAGAVRLGRVFVFDRGLWDRPRFIINFPTKAHWRQRSRLEDVRSGLADLAGQIRDLEIKTLAVPPLGSGLGGLPWTRVRALIEEAFAGEAGTRILVFEPARVPESEGMLNRTEAPRLTMVRAALLGLMRRYCIPEYGYRLTMLEIQKLAYFLQEAGQPLELDFSKRAYGPYADRLRHVLDALEGHFISGLGDGRNGPNTPIQLLPETDQAEAVIAQEPPILKRFGRVARLIEGFEQPFGMELLATVHWVVVLEGKGKVLRDVLKAVRAWNPRKAKLMQPWHIQAALDRLTALSWI